MKLNSGALLPLAAVLSLTACAQTPMGPTMQIMPAPGKDYNVFLQEQQFCKNQAEQAVKGQAESQNHKALYGALATTVLGAGLGAAAGGGTGAGIGAAAGAAGGGAGGGVYSQSQQNGIQTQYNNAYAQCMVAYHNILPGYNNQLTSAGTTTHKYHHTTPHRGKAATKTTSQPSVTPGADTKPAAASISKSNAPLELD